ncbi:MAG: methylated-DNA--[protein]-cysteine S-methyltransferase [Candidatus Omnitrophica bacterium]|nr:methylated-DNA--[protein]-cysteine S-methyltransferase [Candidatus Omnitrophota bacterium]
MAVAGLFYTDCVKTKLATFQIVATQKGLVQINFPKHRDFSPRTQRDIPASVQRTFHRAKKYLKAILYHENGNQGATAPVDWSQFRPFERSVYKALCRISLGKTISYSELAKKAGHFRAARAVGNAMNRNPIPIVIPCHRVIRKDQTLGGYRAGLRWKRLLLNLEQGRGLI